MGGVVGFFLVLFLFLCRKALGATPPPPPSPNILKNWCNIHSETIFSRLNVCILSKSVCGVGFFLPLKGAVFWWFGNCFLATFEEFQPYCNSKSRGPHGKTFRDYFSLANCEYVFHVSFSHHSIGSADIDGTSVYFILFYFFSSFLISPRSPPPAPSSPNPPTALSPPPSSPIPSYRYPIHLSSPRSLADCRGRHWNRELDAGLDHDPGR